MHRYYNRRIMIRKNLYYFYMYIVRFDIFLTHVETFYILDIIEHLHFQNSCVIIKITKGITLF